MDKDKMKYTLQHRKKYREVARELKVLRPRHYLHDLDKVILYLTSNKSDRKEISDNHRKRSRHHDNGKTKTKSDYMDMIIDWECARFTKSDKPLNAEETLDKYYSHLRDEIYPVLLKLGLC